MIQTWLGVALIGLAALIVLGCGPTRDDPPVDVDPGTLGGVLAPAMERPDDLAGWLSLPDDVSVVDFPYSLVSVEAGAEPLELGVLLANSGERRSRGMMYWRGLPPRMGMLFIWEELRGRSGGFWNPNVPIDLDVAWLAEDGTILEFSLLLADDSTTKSPQQEYYFVLEMPRGRFAELGIEVGDRIAMPESVRNAGLD